MRIGEEQVTSLYVGDMGIKAAIIGDEIVYTRPGGYIYLYLDTSEEKEN